MSFTTKQTPRGQVVVGDLPSDFLRIPSTSQSPNAGDEMQLRGMPMQQTFFGNYAPTNVIGRLSVTITQARLAKNYSITKMDPYCRVRIGHAVFETPTHSGSGKNPQWNKTVQCYLPHGVDHAYLEIFDEKTFQVDDRIAWAHIAIPERIFSGDTVDDWYNLNGKQGDGKEGNINIIFSFSPLETQLPVQTTVQLGGPQVVMIPSAPGMTYPAYAPAFQPMPVVMNSPQGAYGVDARPPPSQPIRQPVMCEDDLNQIKEMFPNIDLEVIKSVAEAQRHSKEATINALLNMDN